MRLLIDPGHGGTDLGCQGNGLAEKNITLAIGRMVMAGAEAMGIEVYMTRAIDRTMSLSQRAVAGKFDLVLAVHCDTSTDPRAGYLAAYAQAKFPVSAIVGAAIERAAPPLVRPKIAQSQATGRGDWTIRADNVLSVHPGPAVLVECGFLSNPRHAAYLSAPVGQYGVACALLSGVSAAWDAQEPSANA